MDIFQKDKPGYSSDEYGEEDDYGNEKGKGKS
jgi:hypothetical protein